MDIVVKGRNVEVPEHYREFVSDKLARLERYDKKAMRFDVELLHEPNPRQAKNCQRVEITLKGRGPAVRSEARAGDFYAAFDAATRKLENRLRRMHDRRKVHYGKRQPASVAEVTYAESAGSMMPEQLTAAANQQNAAAPAAHTAVMEASSGADTHEDSASGGQHSDSGSGSTPEVPSQRWERDGHGPGQIVREKEHTARPMTVDQALYQMELVGHDFYLFSDSDSGNPSVVYRRKGFDYGVIRLV